MCAIDCRGFPSRRHLLVALALLAAVTLAGCGLLFGDDGSGTGLPDGEEAAEQYLSLDGYEATAHYEYSDGTDRRARIQVDVGGHNSRVEWLAPPRVAGNVNVYNGSTLVRYNATTNEYARISTEDLDFFREGANRIEGVVDNARAEGQTTVEGPPAGGAPLPEVPAGERSSGAGNEARFEVTYEGTETVAGREAHVISYEAVEDTSEGVIEQTVWLDTEHFITLKSRQVSRFDGNESTYTFRLSNVSFDPGLTDADFRFDPPPGATLNESESYDLTSYDTRTQLVSASDISVPNPAIPERFELVRADHIDGSGFTAVQFQYRASGSVLFVTKTTERDYTDLSEGERVSVGSRSGRYRVSKQQALVTWRCGERVYVVAGDVGRSTLLDVARSVECA